ncbi:MAG: hypothetical protein MI717_04030 [Spirochaetales bacterium]|nr:hypothetical protein [Spirochaetales bacterium]
MVNVTEERIKRLIQDFTPCRYEERVPLTVTYTQDSQPIPLANLEQREFQNIELGTQWGELWDSAWFRFSGEIPKDWAHKTVVALIDIGGEGCLFENGYPRQGITYKKVGDRFERKRRVMLHSPAQGGEMVSLLMEGAANGLFGDNFPLNPPWPFYRLNQAELAVFNKEAWKLSMDMDFLFSLWKTLDEKSPRARRILRGLDDVANLTPLKKHLKEALQITGALIQTPANSSALTAWSVGHAHLDLGWLWPYRETRRKGGRTFSTALRMMEEYPEYIFGASQPQLFEWVKEDYPELYAEVKEAVKRGQMECQGAMWVEPDTNVPSGESLVRQCLYGKRFFQEEFGKDVRNLWLPDVFGYSAALPQILRKSDVDFFVTQKISWNETNVFPHHTFIWKGIDGTPIPTHFLPTDTYNCENTPEIMEASQKRFAQGDVQDGFLNLYGIGDGGGGPSRRHIEWMNRGADCEGLPKTKSAAAEDFLHSLAEKGYEKLPEWKGELYLELHRGTYTTQAKMKKYNRQVERALQDVEFLSSMAILAGVPSAPSSQLERLWKNTLLNQFHDVLPGSSIAEVYEDAHRISEESLSQLQHWKRVLGEKLFPIEEEGVLTLVNTQDWPRKELVEMAGQVGIVEVPALGAKSLNPHDAFANASEESVTVSADGSFFENAWVQVQLASDGTVSSLKLKSNGREMLADGANRFLLYEDCPYFWDAWDVSPYYRNTIPEQAVLVNRRIESACEVRVRIIQDFQIGQSSIHQVLELRATDALLRSEVEVDWNEENKMLRLNAVPQIQWPTATYEIQFGLIERPTHSNTSWDAAQFEVCGHRFADYSQTDRGLALINDCKYGYRILDGVMELNLLRSP